MATLGIMNIGNEHIPNLYRVVLKVSIYPISTISTISSIYPKVSCLQLIVFCAIIITTEAAVNLNETRKCL